VNYQPPMIPTAKDVTGGVEVKLLKSWTFLDSHLGRVGLAVLVELNEKGQKQYVLLQEQMRFGQTVDPIKVAEEVLAAVGRILEEQK